MYHGLNTGIRGKLLEMIAIAHGLRKAVTCCKDQREYSGKVTRGLLIPSLYCAAIAPAPGNTGIRDLQLYGIRMRPAAYPACCSALYRYYDISRTIIAQCA